VKHSVFAANWKMNHAPSDARAFLSTFLAHYPRQQDRTVIFFPPALTLHVVHAAIADRPDLGVGVQNIHWEDKGAFTGENSAPIARAAGARYALIGHSERRHVFGETDEETGRKTAAAVRAGLTPVICIGETLAQREADETAAVVIRQLRAAVAHVEPNDVVNSLVAYEPVWAIGTGKTATPADASTVHQAIRSELRALTGDRGAALPILYGGSVSRGNAESLLAAVGIDGLLVGGASLDAEGWAGIART
jgi:triosephosphate isomerase